MATWTQVFSAKNQYSLKLAVTETSYSVANNTSTISYSLSMSVSDWSGFEAHPTTITLKIGNETVYSSNQAISFNAANKVNGDTWVITSVTGKTITRSTDDDNKIACYAYVNVTDIGFSPGYATISQDLPLTTFCTITYNGNGADSGTMAVTRYAYATSGTTTLRKNAFKRTGYTFSHWLYKPYNTTYSDEQKWNLSNKGNYTLYAIWEKEKYTISYNANEANVTNVPTAQTKTYKDTLTLSTQVPKRANSTYSICAITYNANGGEVEETCTTTTRTTSYEFAGWKANTDGKIYKAGASYTDNQAVTLSAQWNESTSDYAEVTLPTPTRSNYNFRGWSTDSEATFGLTDSYTPENGVTSVTLYAIWELATYTITYATDSDDAIEGQTEQIGASLTLRDEIPVKASTPDQCTVTFSTDYGFVYPACTNSIGTTVYTFINWNTEPDGSGTVYEPGDEYTESTSLTLYAQYESVTSNYQEIAMPTPIKAGHAFLGWAINADATTGITGTYSPSDGHSPSEGITLYAIWRKKRSSEHLNLIYVGSKQCSVCIKSNNKFKKATPHVFIDKQWKACK